MSLGVAGVGLCNVEALRIGSGAHVLLLTVTGADTMRQAAIHPRAVPPAGCGAGVGRAARCGGRRGESRDLGHDVPTTVGKSAGQVLDPHSICVFASFITPHKST